MPDINRREFVLRSTSVAAALLAGRGMLDGAPPERSPFGVCIYSYGATRKFADTLEFLDHCDRLGAAGIQMPLTSLDRAFAEKVRAAASERGMYYEGIVSLPKQDTVRFEQELIAAQAAGAKVVRSACLSGRRYETFNDLAQWEKFVGDSHRSLAMAVPVLEKHKIALALENHKDWTVDEMLNAFQKNQSEYLGVCLDFGNNISLLDAPDAVGELAPYALSTHVKDVAVQSAPDGFLMSEVPLGEGVVDVKALVDAVRAAHPTTRFSFEMITRDPLSIPCLTEKYWATFPNRSGLFLAKSLELVKSRSAKTPLVRVSERPKEGQAQLAEQNLKLCLDFAREHFAS